MLNWVVDQHTYAVQAKSRLESQKRWLEGASFIGKMVFRVSVFVATNAVLGFTLTKTLHNGYGGTIAANLWPHSTIMIRLSLSWLIFETTHRSLEYDISDRKTADFERLAKLFAAMRARLQSLVEAGEVAQIPPLINDLVRELCVEAADQSAAEVRPRPVLRS